MKRWSLLLGLLVVLLVSFDTAHAQGWVGGSIGVDAVQGLAHGDTVYVGSDLRWILRLRNDSFNFAFSNGFRVFTPDGATWDSTRGDTLGWRPGDPTPGVAILGKANFDLPYGINYFPPSPSTSVGSDTVGFIAAKIFATGLPPNFNDTAWAVTAFNINPSSHGKHICVDSTWFRPGGTWKWQASGGIQRFPAWSGQVCYTIVDPNQPTAELVVVPDSLGFTATEGGANPAAQQFNVSEFGGTVIPYSASEAGTWLSLTNASGNTPADVGVNVDITGVAAGTYTELVTVSSTSAPSKTVKVTLVVNPAPKVLVVSPDTLRFTAQEGGANPASQNFNVSEAGGAAIAYTAGESATWLSLTNPSGTTPGDVTVNVIMAGVTAGSYTDLVTVTAAEASNSPQLVVIELTVTPAASLMAISPDTLKFIAIEGGPNPPNGQFQVTSTGGSVDYFAEDTSTWFSLLNEDSVTPDSVQVLVDITGLVPGNYFGDVTFTSGTAENSPQARVVMLTVVARPKILVTSPDTLYFTAVAGGANPASQTFAVSEQGGAVIPYTSLEGASWLSLTNASGNTPDLVTVNVDIAGLTDGSYSEAVVTTSADAVNADTVVVLLDVSTCPQLILTPASRNYSVYTNTLLEISDSIQLTRAGGAAYGWNILNDAGFQINPTSGVTPGVMTIYDTITYLSPGTFTRCILIEDSACSAIDSFCVTVEVTEAPCALIVTSDSLLSFNVTQGDSLTTPAARSLFVYSSDDLVSFEFTVSSDSAWVHFAPTFGTSPESILVSVDPTGLLPGTYFADCRISTDNIYVCEPKFKVVTVMMTVVDSTANQFCAWVVDPDGIQIPGAFVDLYASFPDSNTWLDRQISDSSGAVWFPSFPDTFDLFAHKDGYYPAVANDLSFGNKGVMLVLHPLRPVVVTSQWVDYFCDNNLLNDYPLPAGSVVEATEPGGLLVGQFYVTEFGKYGFMPVYRANDTLTDTLGAMTGDVLTFWVNGQMAIANGDVTYPAAYDRVMVCLNAGGVIQKNCPLQEGWNLVSWNIDTPVDFLPDILAPIDSCIEVVLGFEGGGLTYDPTLPQFSTLWYADHYSGYWIKVRSGCSATLSLTGIPVPANTAIHVYRGWNLVSYLPESPLAPVDALSSIASNLVIAYGFDNGIQIYRPSGGQFNTLTEMSTCHGYWVKVTQNGDLVYPGGAGTTVAAVENPHNIAARLAVPSDITPTMSWMNLYSADLTLDGRTVKAGTTITAHTESGVKVGSFTLAKDGSFGFMPVYADDEGNGLKRGETFVLKVNGVETNEQFTYGTDGDRLEVAGLTAKSSDATLPGSFELAQNYPNPFNPSTTISFSLPVGGKAKLEIYNILGVLVATPYDGAAEAGKTDVVWDGKNASGETVASGVYLYRLTSGSFTETRKMMLLK
ncbi:MAG: T9SS type A sorting domain-containing protein [Candidatus Zixiibacteriota bacterium]